MILVLLPISFAKADVRVKAKSNSALTFSCLCLSDVISHHFDHQAFRFSRGVLAARFIGSQSSYQRIEPHLKWWLMAADTPQGSLCPRFLHSRQKKKKKDHKPLYSSVCGSLSVSLSHCQWLMQAPTNTHKTHTHTTPIADLMVGWKSMQTLIKHNCGKSLSAGSPAGSWTVKMTTKKSKSISSGNLTRQSATVYSITAGKNYSFQGVFIFQRQKIIRIYFLGLIEVTDHYIILEFSEIHLSIIINQVFRAKAELHWCGRVASGNC